MDFKELIRTRKSIRTFDGRALSADDKATLCEYFESVSNPYGIPVEFVLLDAEEYGLSSPVIVGEKLYIAGKVRKQEHCEEAFGYSFEKMVLYAWSLGIGTTWIGGTMNRALFEEAAGKETGVIMPIVSPLGYPASEQSEVDKKLRDRVRGDDRLPVAELFYDGNFDTPLLSADEKTEAIIDAVRWAPSAVNLQPWRIVKEDDDFHFYLKHVMGYTANPAWEVQKIDLGIAICHAMSVAGGQLYIADPGIRKGNDTEYIATVRV